MAKSFETGQTSVCWYSFSVLFSARCNIYISRLCYDVSVRLSVRLSVTEVHWRIIANLVFKFRSKFTAHCGRGLAVHAGASTELFIVQWAREEGSSPGRVGGSSRAMLATARPSCYSCCRLAKRVTRLSLIAKLLVYLQKTMLCDHLLLMRP